MNLSSLTGIAGIGAIVAAVTAGWSYVRLALAWLTDLIICRTVVSGEAGDALLSYCWARGRRSPFGARSFGGGMSWVQPKNRRQLIGFENITSDPVLFWFGRAPMIIRRRQNNEHQNSGLASGGDNNDYYKTLIVTSIRGTVDMDAVVIHALEHYNNLKQGLNGEGKRQRFAVHRLGNSNYANGTTPAASRRGEASAPVEVGAGDLSDRISQKSLRLLQWKPEDLIAKVPDRSAFHGYAFPESVMEALDEMRDWLEHEDWFRSKSIPWRRGWLLHGPPGCGKSTLTRAIAMKFDLPIFVIDLSSHDNETFVSAWAEVTAAAPCIALIEDVDAVFRGRENIATKNTTRDSLTFDCILNCISGVGNSEGVFLIVTTNHPETLDPALGVVEKGRSSRPGRIDRVIELGPMKRPEREVLARHILSDFPDEIPDVIALGDGMTPAQFQDLCAQTALHRFWAKKPA